MTTTSKAYVDQVIQEINDLKTKDYKPNIISNSINTKIKPYERIEQAPKNSSKIKSTKIIVVSNDRNLKAMDRLKHQDVNQRKLTDYDDISLHQAKQVIPTMNMDMNKKTFITLYTDKGKCHLVSMSLNRFMTLSNTELQEYLEEKYNHKGKVLSWGFLQHNY